MFNHSLTTRKKFVECFFYVIPILLIINLFMRWNLTRTISPDSKNYFELAISFPKIPDSLFPIFYPLVLRILNIFFNDYEVTYKVLAFSSLIFTLIFVRFKNFYWKEIWILMSFLSFLRMAPWALSEVIIIPLFILIFYVNSQFLTNKKRSNDFIIQNSILLIITILTKYSSVFIIIGFILFSIFLYFRKRRASISYLISSCIALLGTFLYLSINYYYTGNFTGKRIPPDGEYFNIRLSISQIFFNLNPFFLGKVEKYLGFFSFEWSFSYLAAFIFLIIWLFLLINAFLKKIIPQETKFLILLNISAAILFLLGTIYSYFTTKIDILDFRLLLGFYTFFFFSVICALPNFKNKDLLLLVVALFCGTSNIINLL